MLSSADTNAPSPLLGVPLEVRHVIFSHVAAARNLKPRYALRYWFEKADIQEQIDALQQNDPDADVTYVAGYNHQYSDEDEPEVQDNAVVDDDGENDEDENQDEDDENDEDDEDQQDGADDGDAADEDEDNIDNEDEEMSDEQDDLDDGATTVPDIAQGGNVATTSGGSHQLATDNTGADNNQVSEDVYAPMTVPNVAVADAQGGDENAVKELEAEQGTCDAETADAGGEDTTAGDDTAAAAATSTTEVVVRPNHKWRHVSKFMRLTQCPPEANLFLISKLLNMEAKKWFYDVATLKIDATASFLHFSFFELALTKLAEAPFSPMENIKNAEITLVWDTTWIRAEPSGFAGAVFPVFLKNRVDFIVEILLRAPELNKVKIIWHDSAQDDGAMQVRADTLEPFIMNLKAVIEIEDHYIAPDAKPRASSRAGKQRLEFKAIIDNGCETF